MQEKKCNYELFFKRSQAVTFSGLYQCYHHRNSWGALGDPSASQSDVTVAAGGCEACTTSAPPRNPTYWNV